MHFLLCSFFPQYDFVILSPNVKDKSCLAVDGRLVGRVLADRASTCRDARLDVNAGGTAVKVGWDLWVCSCFAVTKQGRRWE